MNTEENIKVENISSGIEKEDQKSLRPENTVINVLEGSNTISITEEIEPTDVTPLNNQTNAAENTNNFLPNGSKVNIDFGLNSLQFVINSQEIYDKEPEDKESLSKGIKNSYINNIQKPKEILSVNGLTEKSKENVESAMKTSDISNIPAPLVFLSKTKRKRGRPRKGTYTKRTTVEKYLSLKERNFSRALSFSKKSMFLNTHEKEGDNENGGNLKRRRKSRKMKDYVTDFDSSDEKETKPFNTLMENRPQFRRNVSARRINKQNHIKDTNIMNMDIDENLIFESDFLNESSLEISESDSEMSQSESPQIENHKQILEIGPEKKTKLEVINTGEEQTIEGIDNIIYHLVTTTDNTSTISQLLVPNTVKNENIRNTPGIEQGSINKKGASNSRILSSKENKLKEKLERSYQRKLAEVKRKVNLHLDEVRRRPGSSLSVPEVLNSASNFLTEEQLLFLSMQLKTKNDQAQSMRFSVGEKLLSLALYQQSPSVYKYLTTVFHLPSKLVLERWLEGVAKADPLQAKRLMYHVYAKYIYRV